MTSRGHHQCTPSTPTMPCPAMNPSPPQARTQTSTGNHTGGGGEPSRRGLSNRPSSAMSATVSAPSVSHHRGRVSHHPRDSGSTRRPAPPRASDAAITATMAVRCQRYSVMIRVLSSTTDAHARGRDIHRARSGSRARTTPACSIPRKASVTRVGYELFTTASSRPIIDTG